MFSGELKPLGASSDLKRSPNVVCTRTGPSGYAWTKHALIFNPGSKTQSHISNIVNFQNRKCTGRGKFVLTVRAWNYEAKLGRYNDRGDRLLVASKRRTRRWGFALSNNRLCSGVPMPQQYSAIGTAGSDVTIRCYVALAARQTRHDAVVAEHDLYDFSWND